MSSINERSLMAALGYQFVDHDLLVRALTHRSAGGSHYERLEFLGDGLLNFLIAESVFMAWPKAAEGDLSRWRASLVCEDTLAQIGKRLNLGEMLRFGVGELKSGGFRRESILADAFEGIVGAIYLDGGYVAAKTVVNRLFESLITNPPDTESLKDSKTRLQEYLQAQSRPLPEYRVESENGPAHRRVFEVICQLPDCGTTARAGGTSRKQAEQDAARLIMQTLIEKRP